MNLNFTEYTDIQSELYNTQLENEKLQSQLERIAEMANAQIEVLDILKGNHADKAIMRIWAVAVEKEATE